MPAEWLAFWLELAKEHDDNNSTAVVKHDREPNGGGGWSYVDHCDVCGRDGQKKPDCRQNHNGEILLCKHGNSYSPPPDLKKDQVIEGATKKWRFNGIVTNEVGTFSRFILDALPTMPKPSQGSLRQKQRVLVEPDMAMFGKALGNGYAVTATIGRREVMKSAQSTFISSTFWTERIGPTAALKTLEVMEREKSWLWMCLKIDSHWHDTVAQLKP